ncbi:hypothetical protein NIE88_18915 [Sporolactobacillus shoreicorticis]|uniref:Phage protein n=1 Tax=Sporolactobacillus shoreicorticis TaxID=1923877 RepID=A0ABW5S7F0_9BACL|nr:hypothetical protein [Sporolactobacillus shoreicorticis]MCO7127822.1 hypothetical protein [Sporolactobacillus shoreicorticis]
MIVVATNAQLYGRVTKISVSGDYSTTFDGSKLEIHFECPFDDDAKPNTSTVDIYNLSKDTIGRIHKGDLCTVQAGYRGDYGVIASGRISTVLTKKDGVDKITTISFLEGEDYSNKKVTLAQSDPAQKYYVKQRVKLSKPEKKVTYKNGRKYVSIVRYKTVKVAKYRKRTKVITFNKGTHGTTIIKRLCKDLGVKLAKLSIPYNKVYKKGYRVTGLIENNLEEVVKDCKASMYYRRGKMVIRSIEEGDDEHFTLNSNSGLVESPEPFDDDENGKGYTVKCLLQHRITTASIITVKSQTANGKYRAKSGKHYSDGTDFLTEVNVI